MVWLVIFLVVAVLWVFGTLPWLVMNYFFCFPEPNSACDDPAAYTRYARHILSFDLILVIVSGFAIAQLRRLRRRA
ncbi:MAG: hypothetical protein VKK04_21605 [Synechococcales bacterium]|nr:hypothetical protein [Synechococcales bacterium]